MRRNTRSNWTISDDGEKRTRGSTQIAILAIEHVNWNCCLQMGIIDSAQRPEPQLLLDTAFRQERDPYTRLDQSFLGSHAVDSHDRHIF